MIALLAVVVPLSLSAAVSPMMLSEQTVVLAGPNGRRAGWLYALGTLLVVVVVVGIVTLVGHSVRLPSAPHIDAGSDIVLGVTLAVIAAVIARRPARPRAPEARGRRALSQPQALGFGVFSMATNVTTLAIVVVATKDIAAAGLPWVQRVVPLAVVVLLASLPAWLPVALTAVSGDPADRALARVGEFVSRHGHQLVVLVPLVVGLFLVLRGVVRLTGL